MLNEKVPANRIAAVLAGALAASFPFAPSALSQTQTTQSSGVLRIVHEPRLVPSVSSKSEGAWTCCKWCNAKIRYTKSSRWDPYSREWIDVTKEVPQLCKDCQKEEADLKKLEREEARIDRKIESLDAKQRIKDKEREYRRKRLKRTK